MDLSGLLNVAYAFLTEGADEDERAAFDRRLAGFSGPTPRSSGRAQRDLMSAMNLGGGGVS